MNYIYLENDDLSSTRVKLSVGAGLHPLGAN